MINRIKEKFEALSFETKDNLLQLLLLFAIILIYILNAVSLNCLQNHFTNVFNYSIITITILVPYVLIHLYKLVYLDRAFFRKFQLFYLFLLVINLSCFFGGQYYVLEKYYTGSFNISNPSNYPNLDFYYYSIITIATVGYGDIYPISITAKALTVTEVFYGIYILIIIVSNLNAFFKPPANRHV